MTFSSVEIMWIDAAGCAHWLTTHNSTIGAAMKRAEQQGLVVPKWWQFWKAKPLISTLI